MFVVLRSPKCERADVAVKTYRNKKLKNNEVR